MIIRHYSDEVIACPTCNEDCLEKEQGFRERWNLSHAVGTIDGKHILIRCPRLEGSNSTTRAPTPCVLLGLVDTDYKFIWFDIDGLGSSSDCPIFIYSDLSRKTEDTTIGLPQEESLVDHGPQVE